MGFLSELLKDFPALAVAKERIALFEERLKLTEEENGRLKSDNSRLIAENAALKVRLEQQQASAQFAESHGVLWKSRNGNVERIAYCPICRVAMSEFPPGTNELLVCSKCDFQAPFRPKQTAEIAESVSNELS